MSWDFYLRYLRMVFIPIKLVKKNMHATEFLFQQLQEAPQDRTAQSRVASPKPGSLDAQKAKILQDWTRLGVLTAQADPSYGKLPPFIVRSYSFIHSSNHLCV